MGTGRDMSRPLRTRRRPRVLYVSYHGAGTPLVRSQVLPYLRGLRDVADFHLLCYEGASVERRPPDEETRGITLHTLSYHKRPNLPAKIFDIAVGIARSLWIVLRHDIRLIHARSHVAAAIAAVVGTISGRPWIFDMRGFLADEFVEAGAWRPHGPKYRIVRAVEIMLLRYSSAIIVLTRRAVTRLRTDPGYVASVGATSVAVIPCAVDIETYQIGPARDRPPTLVYLGSVGTWYLLDEMLRYFGALLAARPGSRFLIVNRGQHSLILEAIARAELPTDCVDLIAADFSEIPDILSRCSAGIVLLREGLSKLGSSPIKLSEYLACGLPVVVNAAVGDAPQLLASARAGVVLRGIDDDALQAGAAELLELIDEGDEARRRARALAESYYSLTSGVAAYREVYEAFLGRVDR